MDILEGLVPAFLSSGFFPGPLFEKEAPVHISNVALVCPSTDLPTRRKLKIEDEKKVRVSARDGSMIPHVG